MMPLQSLLPITAAALVMILATAAVKQADKIGTVSAKGESASSSTGTCSSSSSNKVSNGEGGGKQHAKCDSKANKRTKDSVLNGNSNLDLSDMLRNVNSLPALVAQDAERVAFMHVALQGIPQDSSSDPKATAVLIDRFHRIVSSPLQAQCLVGKYLGGEWLSTCGFLDGVKFVCMDGLMDAIDAGNCLVYSFGIAKDWSFENTMEVRNDIYAIFWEVYLFIFKILGFGMSGSRL